MIYMYGEDDEGNFEDAHLVIHSAEELLTISPDCRLKRTYQNCIVLLGILMMTADSS